MSHKSKYKVGDMVMTHTDVVENYGPEVCNQLCIVREVRDRVDQFRNPWSQNRYRYVYVCTTISTNEEVKLWEREIVDAPEG